MTIGNNTRSFTVSHKEVQSFLPDEEISFSFPHLNQEDVKVSQIGNLILIKVDKMEQGEMESTGIKTKRWNNSEIVLELPETIDQEKIYSVWRNHELILGFLFKTDEKLSGVNLNRDLVLG